MNNPNIPAQPKCPKGAKCAGAHAAEFGLYIPDCIYSGDPGIINKYAKFVCPSCGSYIRFWYFDDNWEMDDVYRA